MRAVGFAKQRHFRAGAARWVLVVALGGAVASCNAMPSIPNPLSDTFSNISSLPGKMVDILPGRPSTTDTPAAAELLRAGDAAREKGDLDGAAADYAKAAAADPTSHDAQLRLGAISLARKDNNGAFTAYEAAQTLAPKDPEAAFRLGEIELTRGDAKAASDQFSVAIEARKGDPKLYNAMGVALSMQGKYDLARQNYDQGLALEPDYPALRNNYGLMQLESGDLPGALATFSSLVASPQATERYRLNRALVELAMGRTDAALADAPGMDEPGLRQTLATYLSPPPADTIAARAMRIGKVLVGGASAISPSPAVNLAVDAPRGAVVATAPVTDIPKPIAVLPPATAP